MSKKPNGSRFSPAFYQALEAIQPYGKADEAMAKLRTGTTVAELVEATGWPITRVQQFIRTITGARPDMMVVKQEDEKAFYKLIDRH